MSLAYEKNVDLAFDTTVLRNCAAKYNDIATELRTMCTRLDTCIGNLKNEGWTTPAGTVFYEMTKTNWSENIEKYAALLNTLSTILTESSAAYEAMLKDSVRTTKVNIQ